MKTKLSYIWPLAVALASCSVEAPFSPETADATGTFHKASLALDVQPDELPVRASSLSAQDFTVDFLKADGQVQVSYSYASMPEVVVLPVGTYSVHAYCGEDPETGWDTPYYSGTSGSFDVVKDKVVASLAPVVCKLSNVRVSVVFDPSLGNSDDLKVTVSLKKDQELEFTPSTVKSGYFKFDKGVSMAAVFSGTVEGELLNETKTYAQVEAGHHYKITFKLRQPNSSGNGDLELPGDEAVKIDANVNISAVEGSSAGGFDKVEEDETMDNILFPDENNDPNQGGDEPTPPVPGNPPVITANDGIDLEGVNDYIDGMECVLKVHSDSGIQKFEVNIDSETLTPDELEGVGLAADFDLANPADEDQMDALGGLGFLPSLSGTPEGPFESLKGKKDAEMSVTDFLPMLGALGAANHTFNITVTDANGTAKVALRLRTL